MIPLNEYDIVDAFRIIEEELIASMIRNMDRHRAEETKEGIEWSMWQAEQLRALEKYKNRNQKKYRKKFKVLNREIEEMIRQARQTGNMQQEIRILQAIRKGYKVHGNNKSPAHQAMTAEFFRLNEQKLEALIEATTHDMEKAETAILRMSNDQYRKAIFNAQVYANTGAGTYEKAVDMATRDMLAAGLNCIVYSNGARHTLSDYADMALRTASKRAYLQGEGEKRQEWGIHTVIMAKRGNPCPKCLPFVGKVLIDDVWSGGSRKDGKYPLMSKAIEHGLYHPRCKDSHTTYFPGISTADDTWTEEELEKIGQNYEKEQKQQYAKRQAEKFERLAMYSLDEENRNHYAGKKNMWQEQLKGLGATHFSNDMPEHDSPVLKKTIDYNDQNAVIATLEEFERDAIESGIEKACVITRNGEVYECYGSEDRVFIDADLGDKLHGAYVSHNHPALYTEYSFSSDDFELFMNYELEVLRGEDVKYKYEFTRRNKTVDEHISIFDLTEEDYAHEKSIANAEIANIGYRRWKND